MGEQRDKFLTEAMGECWHKWRKCNPDSMVADDSRCIYCKVFMSTAKYHNADFSTWEGFGKLWEWSQKQEWFSIFALQNNVVVSNENYVGLLGYIVHPDRFADAVYAFLKDRKGRYSYESRSE